MLYIDNPTASKDFDRATFVTLRPGQRKDSELETKTCRQSRLSKRRTETIQVKQG